MTQECVVMGFLFLAAVGKAEAVQSQSHEEQAVQHVLEAYAQFGQSGNIAGMDTLFAHESDVHIIEGAGVNHGWADYRDNHLKPELEHLENFQYRYYAVEPQVRGSIAWASFQYEVVADTPRGHVEVDGRGTAVLEKRDGRWLMVHLHTSGRPRETER
jgi:ketosteroid isomerase-like protein